MKIKDSRIEDSFDEQGVGIEYTGSVLFEGERQDWQVVSGPSMSYHVAKSDLDKYIKLVCDQNRMDFKSCIGKFDITRDLLDRHPETTIEVLNSLDVLIVRAESMYIRDAIEYFAYSKNFDPVKIGDEAPKYIIEIKNDGQGNFESAHFEKQKL